MELIEMKKEEYGYLLWKWAEDIKEENWIVAGEPQRDYPKRDKPLSQEDATITSRSQKDRMNAGISVSLEFI